MEWSWKALYDEHADSAATLHTAWHDAVAVQQNSLYCQTCHCYLGYACDDWFIGVLQVKACRHVLLQFDSWKLLYEPSNPPYVDGFCCIACFTAAQPEFQPMADLPVHLRAPWQKQIERIVK